MPLLLRKITSRTAWVPPQGNLKTAIEELREESKAVSVWYIEEDRSNLDRVIAALAATRDSRAFFDYILFDERLPARLGIAGDQDPGNVPDKAMNLYHRNLIFDSEEKLTHFAQCLLEEAGRGGIARKTQSEVVGLIAACVLQGHIRLDDLKPQLRKHIERTLAFPTGPDVE